MNQKMLNPAGEGGVRRRLAERLDASDINHNRCALQCSARLDELLWRLGDALRMDRLDGWEQDFARSILGQAKRGRRRWNPSENSFTPCAGWSPNWSNRMRGRSLTTGATMQRLDRASAAVANALRVLPAAGEPGYPSPGEIAAGLATIFRDRYGPMERLTLASAAFLSLDPDARLELIQAAERDRQAEEFPFPGVDPELWARVCREHRPPPLTKIEKRRAAAIQFDDSPRAILAAAWAGASDRDCRDLVNRVTGRDAA